jgi:hypothetical protein
MSFLFIWQLTFSAPLSIASGSIGLAQYATYMFPSLGGMTKVALPLLGQVEINAIPGLGDCDRRVGRGGVPALPAHHV